MSAYYSLLQSYYSVWQANLNLSGSKWKKKGEMWFLLRPQGEHAVFKITFHFHSSMSDQLERWKKKLGWVGDASVCMNWTYLSLTETK